MQQRHHFTEKIQEIDRELIRMGTRVEEQIEKSIKALIEKDADLAQEVIDGDDAINDFELSIEDKLTVLIATEQPVAGDLRHVITSLKVVTQLERMGDHAVHIGKVTKEIYNQKYMKPLIDIPKMAEIGVEMLHNSLIAFSHYDKDMAIQVAGQDDKVDNLRDQIFRELYTYTIENTKNIRQAASLLFIARWLERFADHVTNICEWIVYDTDGEHIELNL
ncbi:MAG: phosphate signaling complex protein PhoU [Spirochaetia bacterium]|nr:phosphate signaling complex protein PhoU [Spirochaetia bacterium]MCF7953787.1 phosphate signaling complex protein PhoU [Spirochaetales bacterium]